MKNEEKTKVLKDTTLSSNFDDSIAKLIKLKGEPFRKYREKWDASYNLEKVLDFPIHIDFETVYGCNLRCSMCHLHMLHPDAKNFYDFRKFMDPSLIKKVIDEGSEKGLCAVTLNNLGEPLLREDIFELSKYATQKGILDIWMSTNGVLMDTSRAQRLIESGVTRLNISLDANTAETYKKVRENNLFEKIKTNILNLVELKKKMGSVTPIVKVSFCLLKTNEHETDDFVKFWEDKVDNVGIQQYWDANEKAKLKAEKRVVERFSCKEPWHRMAINIDGTASPCCLPWRKGFTFGNAAEQTISEIWNSDKMNRLRTSIKNNNFTNEFQRCKLCMDEKF